MWNRSYPGTHISYGKTVPTGWFPAWLGDRAERFNSRLIGRGSGIHWLLAGRRSCESADSLRRWLAERLDQKP